MNRQTIFFSLAVAMFGILPNIAAAQSEHDSIVEARLRIVLEPGSYLASDSTLIASLVSSDATVAAVLGEKKPGEPQALRITGDFSSSTPTVRLYGKLDLATADKLVEKLAKVLEERLTKLDKDELERELQRQDPLVRRINAFNAEIRQLSTVAAEASAESLGQRIAALQAELQATEVKMLALRARRKAIERQIAEIGEQVQKQSSGDPVLAQLEEIIRIRTKIYGGVKDLMAAGSASHVDLLKAEEAIIEARGELARQRRASAREVGSDRLIELKRRLEDTAIELAEFEAKARHVSVKMQEAHEYLKKSRFDETAKTRAQIERNIKLSDLESTMREFQEIGRKAHLRRWPRVSVISIKTFKPQEQLPPAELPEEAPPAPEEAPPAPEEAPPAPSQ